MPQDARKPEGATRPSKRRRVWESFASSVRVFVRVALYAVGLMALFYLVALALYLLTPSVGLASEAAASGEAGVARQASGEKAGAGEVSGAGDAHGSSGAGDAPAAEDAHAGEDAPEDEAPGEDAPGDDEPDAGGEEVREAPVYDAALGGGSGIMPTGLSEDDATFVSIARLESGEASLNETLVSFRGEVVGEPVSSSSSSYKWVLVQSSGTKTSSIEVLMTNEQVAQIKNWGSYQVKGATVRVTGIYRVADDDYTGALDVTAYVVHVVDEGGPVEQEGFQKRLMVAAVALTLLGATLTGIDVYQKRRSRS